MASFLAESVLQIIDPKSCARGHAAPYAIAPPAAAAAAVPNANTEFILGHSRTGSRKKLQRTASLRTARRSEGCESGIKIAWARRKSFLPEVTQRQQGGCMKVSLEAALLDLKEGKTRLKDEPSQFLAFYGNRNRVGVL